MKQRIETEKAPAPIGPYNQAILAGDTLYVSGQIAIDPAKGEMIQESLAAETRQVMQNIQAILHEAGAGWSEVAKCSIFILDMAHFSTVNEVYGSYFDAGAPARETVAVSALPKGARVEISCIAVKSGW
jgi:2-iminobutanoate/2-iminopropanoate deaminase